MNNLMIVTRLAIDRIKKWYTAHIPDDLGFPQITNSLAIQMMIGNFSALMSVCIGFLPVYFGGYEYLWYPIINTSAIYWLITLIWG